MTAYRAITSLIFCLLMLGGAMPVRAEAPFLDPADDASHLGPPGSMLFWTPEQQVAGYRNMDKVFLTRIIAAGGAPLELPGPGRAEHGDAEAGAAY